MIYKLKKLNSFKDTGQNTPYALKNIRAKSFAFEIDLLFYTRRGSNM